MSDLLARIDAATAGLCPCGAEPRAGSAYCGPDCEPTHISDDTDVREDGRLSTPMRWRPDLVTAAPDDGLTPMCGPIRLGRFTRHIYRREGTSLIHLRLDDGHRWVGADVEESQGEEYAALCHEKWKSLERELGNTRHLVEEDDPWADVMPALLSRGQTMVFLRPSGDRLGHELAEWQRQTDTRRRRSYHNPPQAVNVSADRLASFARTAAQSMQPLIEAMDAFARQSGALLTEWQRHMVERMYAPQLVVLAAERVEVAGYRPAADPDEPPADPMARALWLRKRRNTGPQSDRLDGRRRQRR